MCGVSGSSSAAPAARFESGDNWNLNRLELVAVYRPGAGTGREMHVVSTPPPGPLYRFKEEDAWSTDHLRAFSAPDSVRATARTLTGTVSVPVQTRTDAPKPKAAPPGPRP